MEATAHKQHIAGANEAAAGSFRILVKYITNTVNCYQANLNCCMVSLNAKLTSN
jgi:hypothetical protein